MVTGRLSLSWIACLTVGAIGLRLVLALLHFLCLNPTPTFTRSRAGPDDPPFEETASLSTQLKLRRRLKSEQTVALLHSFDPARHVQRRERRLRPLVASGSHPCRALFPRKLSLSSADNDPFLGGNYAALLAISGVFCSVHT